MKHLKHFLILLPVLSFAVLATAAAGAANERPNIVFVLFDDMGYGHIEPFGSKVNRTPNLNKRSNYEKH
jgi:hypothetical protein